MITTQNMVDTIEGLADDRAPSETSDVLHCAARRVIAVKCVQDVLAEERARNYAFDTDALLVCRLLDRIERALGGV